MASTTPKGGQSNRWKNTGPRHDGALTPSLGCLLHEREIYSILLKLLLFWGFVTTDEPLSYLIQLGLVGPLAIPQKLKLKRGCWAREQTWLLYWKILLLPITSSYCDPQASLYIRCFTEASGCALWVRLRKVKWFVQDHMWVSNRAKSRTRRVWFLVQASFTSSRASYPSINL